MNAYLNEEMMVNFPAKEKVQTVLLFLHFVSWFSMGLYVLVWFFVFFSETGLLKHHLLAGYLIFGLAVSESLARKVVDYSGEASIPYPVLSLLFLLLLITMSSGHFGWATFVAVLVFIPWVCVLTIETGDLLKSTPAFDVLMTED